VYQQFDLSNLFETNLVHVSGLSEFNVSGSDISGRRKFDALLGAGDDN